MLNNPKPGVGAVFEYQISGLPYATASIATTTPTKIDFPYVTSFFTLKNTAPSGTLAVGFTRSGSLGTNRFTLTPSGSFGGDIRVRSLFITTISGSVDYELVAGLTLIDVKGFPILTSSINPAAPDVSSSFSYPGLG